MGMLYAWATPEYLMWNMTIGQILLLHNLAVDIRSPEEKKSTGLSSAAEVVAKRDELRKLYGAIDGNAG
jgi:hypothetical protein